MHGLCKTGFVRIARNGNKNSRGSWIKYGGECMVYARRGSSASLGRSFNILEEHFGNRIIGLDAQPFTGGGITWPPYSPDLNPCDFYLWGSLKDMVYRDGIDTLDNIEMAIRQRIEAIPHATLQAVCGEFEKRLRKVIAARGSHFENLIY
ncbi:hypothetical protein QE152_g34046 [Popillia japonica]|uniref:Uncharacterized protein n=1 Tax=Popillia japonica TaxID=7064 RepID=A0AAW1IUS5_POPJA